MDGTRNLTDDAGSEGEPHWRKAAVFAADPEAELARQQLEREGIPVVVLNDNIGVFGPGFAGASHLGVTVLVPDEFLQDARDLIEDLVEAFNGTMP